MFPRESRPGKGAERRGVAMGDEPRSESLRSRDETGT